MTREEDYLALKTKTTQRDKKMEMITNSILSSAQETTKDL